MNRITTCAIGIAVAGTTLLAPAIAGADPSISVTSGGTPVVNDWTALAGNPIDISGSGCTSPIPGQPTYMGEFASTAGDPLAVANGKVFEQQTSSGAFALDPEAPALTEFELTGETTVFGARFYCSTAPLTTLDASTVLDPTVLWVSPAWTMTLQMPGAQRSVSARSIAQHSTSARPTAATPSGPAVRYSVGADSLPAVDRIGIKGSKAAKLKATVDARAARDARLALRFGRLAKRGAALTPVTSRAYVLAAHRALGVRLPSAKITNTLAARLDAGQTKVDVVEVIALRGHDAAWWNRRP